MPQEKASLPEKPVFLRVALYAMLASVLLVTASELLSEPMAPARWVPLLAGALLTIFLYCHMSRGAVVAVQAYLGLEFLSLTSALLDGRFPYDPSKGPVAASLQLMNVLAAGVTIVGVLHPLTRDWYANVQDRRRDASREQKMALTLSELPMAAAWMLASSVLVVVGAQVNDSSAVPVGALFLLTGSAIAVVQGIKYQFLKHPRG